MRIVTPMIAKPFSLSDFNGSTVSLADFQGRIVLVDFWFPNCGPCRAGFPYLRELIDHYRDRQDVAFLGINVEEGQEMFVLPLLRNEQIHFTPLRGTTQMDYAGVRRQRLSRNLLDRSRPHKED